MPRPRKWRTVCCVPERTLFGPLGPGKENSSIVSMTVEEYETIRLIDFEGMTQEECAASMGVARTTVQRIYNDARKKLSGVIVNGDIVQIGGGDFRLPENDDTGTCRCHRHRRQNGGNFNK